MGFDGRWKQLKASEFYSEGQKRCLFWGGDQVTSGLKFTEADDRSHFTITLLSLEVLNFAQPTSKDFNVNKKYKEWEVLCGKLLLEKSEIGRTFAL